MINCLIFTKNRACQLDLLLESINEYLGTELDIHILAKATGEEYEEGYRRLTGRHLVPNFIWEEDGHFKNQVMAILNSFNHEWTLCFLDDDVVVDYIDVAPFLKHITADINAFSLRMGTHITYCYPKDKPMELPKIFMYPDGDLMEWNWSDGSLDWGYPMSLGGNIYRAKWLKDFWSGLPFTGPNLIEGYMAMNPPWQRPNQVSFMKQKVYNVANNLVQTVCKNRYEKNVENDPDSLNTAYLDGYKIDLGTITGKTYISANGPAEYKLVLGE